MRINIIIFNSLLNSINFTFYYYKFLLQRAIPINRRFLSAPRLCPDSTLTIRYHFHHHTTPCSCLPHENMDGYCASHRFVVPLSVYSILWKIEKVQNNWEKSFGKLWNIGNIIIWKLHVAFCDCVVDLAITTQPPLPPSRPKRHYTAAREWPFIVHN